MDRGREVDEAGPRERWNDLQKGGEEAFSLIISRITLLGPDSRTEHPAGVYSENSFNMFCPALHRVSNDSEWRRRGRWLRIYCSRPTFLNAYAA